MWSASSLSHPPGQIASFCYLGDPLGRLWNFIPHHVFVFTFLTSSLNNLPLLIAFLLSLFPSLRFDTISFRHKPSLQVLLIIDGALLILPYCHYVFDNLRSDGRWEIDPESILQCTLCPLETVCVNSFEVFLIRKQVRGLRKNRDISPFRIRASNIGSLAISCSSGDQKETFLALLSYV